MSKEPFGMELQLDLYGCNANKLVDPAFLQEYVDTLVERIAMKKYGDLILEHFGHSNPKTSGFTFVQLIETSCITGHISEYRCSVHINVFSCADFDPEIVVAYSVEAFEAHGSASHFRVRH